MYTIANSDPLMKFSGMASFSVLIWLFLLRTSTTIDKVKVRFSTKTIIELNDIFLKGRKIYVNNANILTGLTLQQNYCCFQCLPCLKRKEKNC